MRIRRRQPTYIEINDVVLPEWTSFLRGEMSLVPETRISLLCPDLGTRIRISPDELTWLARIPEGEHDPSELAGAGIPAEIVANLVAKGVLVSEDAKVALGESRRERVGWHPLAWLYHGMTQWRGTHGDEGSREHGNEAEQDRLRRHAEQYGLPPTHFPVMASAKSTHPLPLTKLYGELGEILHRRQTTRHFDIHARLSAEQLAFLLQGCFRPSGQQVLAPGMVALRRTSPSGGALHPIEAFPLLIDVEGFVPGLYHYRSDLDALDLLAEIEQEEARRLASDWMIGQSYFADAHALIIHVARLDRHHWKYRRHPKALRAVLLDSGHLSQTFYLLATQLGVGAFFTAAINDGDIADFLGIDDGSIVIGINGAGPIEEHMDTLHLKCSPIS